MTALWALTATGCFFLQPINSEPQARIDKLTPGPHHRGDTIVFSAAKSRDPDGHALVVDWKAFTCNEERTACDAPAFHSQARALVTDPFEVQVPPARANGAEATRLILVVVTVTDMGGAEHEDRLYVEVFNRDPQVDVQVQGFLSPAGSGYPLGTSMQILAAGTDPDGDELSFTWRLFPATGSSPAGVRWERVDDTTHELEPDITGLWRVELTADDGQGGQAVHTESILVQPDAPPCLASTDPPVVPGARYIVDRDAAPRRFAVLSVRDDLDVYPPPPPGKEPMGSATLRWFLATPDTGGALVRVAHHEIAEYVIEPGAYAPGDRITLRVEADDRVGRELVCAPELPTCSLTSDDDCRQRVSWEIEVR